MPEQRLNLIVSCPQSDDDGWTLYSPQVPGLAAGRDTLMDLRHDLPSILRFAGVEPGTPVQVHTENLKEIEGVEYVVRIANDQHAESRQETAGTLLSVLADESQRNLLTAAPVTRTGEVLFIIAEPTDRLRDIAAQLHPKGDVAVIVAPVADRMLWTTHIANSDDLMREAKPLGELGWSENMTVSELMRIDSGPRQALVPIPC
ncbi:hypothetical protein I0C86_35985 [Plantactinospora sp. S1510]|uniref:Uncharacterized protein n=1 Tax=Plantactinospora alkalitolerans TaxID=2789879 RepID=A0ABS0H870_9ACTN|nr:hypothetical protein [Plantactinospora alkalitolerans]MBF9134292.1 hypothetical protein [Plantactinospora alkalitolerans]